MHAEIVWPAWLIAGALSVLWFWLMWRAGRRLRFLADTPTSKAKGVFIGQVELAGRAVLDPPLQSHVAEVACVWYRYTVEERWERWETETYTENGKTKTRMVRRSGWRQIDEGGEAPAFYLEDETGAVQVRPDGAEVEPVSVCDKTVARGDALYFGKAPAAEIADSTGERRFAERALPLRTEIFVTGRAREREDLVAAQIAAEAGQELFLISTRGEAKVQHSLRWRFWLYGSLLVVTLPVALLIQLGAGGQAPNPLLVAAALLLLGGTWLAGWLWMSINSLIGLRNRTAQGWSLIDVQLKRRADLIPRLVELMGGLRDHERAVQAELAGLRSQAGATVPGQPGPDIAGTGPLVKVVAERYPELKTSAAFLRLQRELSDTETRIALARDYYNGIAAHLNTRIEIIPDRWFAPLAALRPAPLLNAESFERNPVPVSTSRS